MIPPRDTLGYFYYPLRIKHQITKKLFNIPRHRLRVMCYHNIAQAEEARFEKQLRWIMRHWDIVASDVFANMLDGREPVLRDTLLLTFDDGTMSNFDVAERVLKPLGIKALFFVVTQYALLTEQDDWREFSARRIYIKHKPDELPGNFRPMSMNELQLLASDGHTIGAHTETHAKLAILNKEELNQEIIGGADRLELHLGYPVRHFAYPFGDFDSICEEASLVAGQRFDYVYSGMRGDNGHNPVLGHLRRDSSEPRDTLLFTGACLEGAADFLYKNKNKICSRWVS